METLKEDILAILNDSKIGPMATLNGEKPYGRYMTFKNEEFTLYTTTEEDSQKVHDLQANRYVHILLGYTNKDASAPYLEYTGKLTEIKDDELKLKIANLFRTFFNSDKGNMVTLQIEPISIKYQPRNGPTKDLLF